MNWDVGSRAASVAITAALAVLISDYNQWVAVVIGFGFAHYLLSFYYARAGLRTVLGSPAMFLPLASLGTLLALFYFLHFPLEIFFGIHHACNEGYLKRRNSKLPGSDTGQLPGARALFHLAAYFCILRFDAIVGKLPEPFLWSFLAIATSLYFIHLRAQCADAGTGNAGVLRESSLELWVLILVGLSFFTRITFLQIVMYHFVLWTIIPLPGIKQQGLKHLVEYGFLSTGAIVFFVVTISNQLFSSYLNLSNSLNLGFYYAQFLLWSYIHITASFALSSAHPQWIVGLFRRQPYPGR